MGELWARKEGRRQRSRMFGAWPAARRVCRGRPFPDWRCVCVCREERGSLVHEGFTASRVTSPEVSSRGSEFGSFLEACFWIKLL